MDHIPANRFWISMVAMLLILAWFVGAAFYFNIPNPWQIGGILGGIVSICVVFLINKYMRKDD